MKPLITQAILKRLVNYNPDTGVFTWNEPTKASNAVPGSIAGSTSGKYKRITLNGRPYTLSKLAFLYMLNEYPSEVLHINGDTLDLRWDNLDTYSVVPAGETTQEILQKFFHYDPLTGIFTRKLSTNRQSLKGTVAGGVTKDGYIVISVGTNRHYAHRLAFLYMQGKWPEDLIDHENMDCSDNRWSNLREATHTENICNTIKRKNHPTGVKGVFLKNNKYRAEIKLKGKVIGESFLTLEEAERFILEHRGTVHGDFSRQE